jgi:hypothetical protein
LNNTIYKKLLSSGIGIMENFKPLIELKQNNVELIYTDSLQSSREINILYIYILSKWNH